MTDKLSRLHDSLHGSYDLERWLDRIHGEDRKDKPNGGITQMTCAWCQKKYIVEMQDEYDTTFCNKYCRAAWETYNGSL